MTLAASGAISASDIRTEFVGGSGTVDMASYYRGANTNVKSNAANNTATNLAANVPTSGAISFNDFYSQAKGWQKTFSSNASQQSGTGIFGDDYSVDYPKTIVINAGVTVYSSSSSTPALDLTTGGAGTITVNNSGNLYGQGGAAQTDGGTALKADVSINVINNSGANIKGGGGGGGNGGAGGVGSQATAAQISSVVDKVGDKPDFVPYSVLTQFVPARAWSGIGSGQWGLNVQQGTSVVSNISNRGPMWYSFQVNTAAEYSLSSSISDPFPEDGQTGHRGTPVVNISTAEDTKSQGQGGADYGSGLSWSGVKANLAANTTYYFCNYTQEPYGSSTPDGRFFYNDMSTTLNLSVNTPSTAGTGGAGGIGQGFQQSATNGASGASGGTNAGTGGAGGNGGALGAAGTNGATGTDGSGTTISYPSTAPAVGSAGTNAGAAGYYILGQSNVSLTNNGTVAGRIA
jgi:hypothetical protein